ncbi:MAG: hypothetical protein ACFFGZ_10750 [Candidatus Thorarchaeota archaeon]
MPFGVFFLSNILLESCDNRMNTYLDIFSKLTESGIVIEFKNTDYPLIYPKAIWSQTPELVKFALRDNLALMTTIHLPLIFNAPGVMYHSGRPILEPYIFQNFLRDIPSCTDVDGTSTDEVVREFLQIDYSFAECEIIYPGTEPPVNSPFRALIGMSFGKDSLLTYAVANEIGLDPEIIYVVEESLIYEQKHKAVLARQLEKEFGRKLHILTHETGKLRDYSHLGAAKSELGWGLQTTEYALEFIPFAYALQGKYLLFGNEQSTAATYMDAEGKWRIYPAYDQYHVWTVHLDQITQMFSGRAVRTGSLIEPLMDMMIQRILVVRYPELAKYQMSCFAETEAGRDYRWCHSCSVCAKMYLLCAGGGVDPQKVGFQRNMLNRDKKSFFTLFGGKSALTYANTPMAHDEQLFAFYLAAKNGIQGDLISEFKRSELFAEAKNREDELVKTFCRIYDSISLPMELKQQVLSIYKEELDRFEI